MKTDKNWVKLRKSGDTLRISPSHCRELKVYACPIGGTFFDELCLLMIALVGGLKPTLHYCGALGRRHRLELRNNGGASPTLPLNDEKYGMLCGNHIYIFL